MKVKHYGLLLFLFVFSLNIVNATTNCAAQGGSLNINFYGNSQGQPIVQNIQIGSSLAMWPTLEVYTTSPYYQNQCVLQTYPNQLINFYLDGHNIGFAVTNQNGQAFLNYSSANLSLGQHSYYAAWRGNSTLVINSSTVQINLVKDNATLGLYCFFACGSKGNSSSIQTETLPANKKVLLFGWINVERGVNSKGFNNWINATGTTLNLYFGSQLVSSNTTNSTGWAKFVFNTSAIGSGNYTVKVSYNGNSTVNPYTLTFTNPYEILPPTTSTSSSTSSMQTTTISINPTTTLNYTSPSGSQSSGDNGWLLPLIIVIVVIGGVYYLLTHRGNSSSTPSKPEPQKTAESDEALKTLKHRYAKGEITKKQFDLMKKDLE